MDLSTPLIIFATQYFYVCAKSSQQLNVTNFKWLRMIRTSYVMGGLYLFEFWVAAPDILSGSIWTIIVLWFFYSTGGWLGGWTGMWLYLRLKNK